MKKILHERRLTTLQKDFILTNDQRPTTNDQRLAFIVPYYGKFPDYFPLWLKTCSTNPTIDFIVSTDDKTQYDYPENVKVHYEFSFDDIRKKFQSHFDFKISLERPYKICDYRPAFGELFAEYLTDYDFWGHCDIDVLWGNFRKFVTDDVLKKYQRIYYFGSCQLYKNTPEVNSWYKNLNSGRRVNYKQAFTSNKSFAFDEWPGMTGITRDLGIRSHEVQDFAAFSSLNQNFFRGYWQEDLQKIKNMYIEWNDGSLYACHQGKILGEFSMLHTKSKFADDLKNKPIPGKFYLLPSGFVTAQENEIIKFKSEPIKIFYWRTKHKIRRSAINFFIKYFPYRFVNFARWLRRRFIMGIKGV